MRVSVALSSDKKSDAIAIGIFQNKEKEAEKFIRDAKVKNFIRGLAKLKRFSGKCKQFFFSCLPSDIRKSILMFGLGEAKKLTLEDLRKLGASLLERAGALKLERVQVELSSLNRDGLEAKDIAAALVEGIRLKEYSFDKYKKKEKDADSADGKLKEATLLVSKRSSLAPVKRELAMEEEIMNSVNLARRLGDEPGGVMTPRRFAEEARKMAREVRLRCRILGPAQIRRMKMGGILSVAKGSKEGPRFIILEHRGSGGKPLVLVGKGITFDSGGISLKPAAAMEFMKYDMCGGAAVIAALRACARLKIKDHVIGLVPTCENLPSSDPQRPGDVHTTYSGKTVEVLNTDAEGRLILADALGYAHEFKPRAIIDLATLTGACVATFGELAMGMMGNNEALLRAIQAAGEKTGERCWQLPLWEEYGEMIKGSVADLKNIGGRYAGTITAGKFLEAFVGDVPWVHLDIAGVAWKETPAYYTKIGATGAGVRLLIRYLRDLKKSR